MFPVNIIALYLLNFKTQLEVRTKGNKGDFWYDLRPCNYYSDFEDSIIAYNRTLRNHKFALIKGRYLIDNCHFIYSNDKYLLSFLNSKLFDFYKRRKFVAFGDAFTTGRCKLDRKKMKRVPIKPIKEGERISIDDLVKEISQLKEDIFKERKNFIHFIELQLKGRKLSPKLKSFWKLDTIQFSGEINKIKELKMKDKKELTEMFEANIKNAKPIKTRIAKIKGELNKIIYAIYDINGKEIQFIEEAYKLSHSK